MRTWDIDLDRCDIHCCEDVLFTTLPDGVQVGDVLAVKGASGVFKAEVVVAVARKTGWQKHSHLVRFESGQAAELRKALTYEVAGRAPDPPRLEVGCKDTS